MKVGDYVRTPQGIIAKIVNIQEDTGQYFFNGNAVSLKSKNYIADKNITIGENFKYSPNIIDLIEVGDYVNGYLIDYIDSERRYLRSERPYREDSTMYKDLIEKGRNYNQCLHFFAEDIKSIVTREQFSQMEYKVKE